MTRAWLSVVVVVFAVHAQSGSARQAHWLQWRGPALNGVAPGDAPFEWSDSRNVSWKVEIPGRGFSSPIVWGDKLFLTTAVPTGKGVTTSEASGGRGPGGNAGVGEHHFVVMSIDRVSGKQLREQTATTATLTRDITGSTAVSPPTIPRLTASVCMPSSARRACSPTT